MLIGLLLRDRARPTQLQPYGQNTVADTKWLMNSVLSLPLTLHPTGLVPVGTLTIMQTLLGRLPFVGMPSKSTLALPKNTR